MRVVQPRLTQFTVRTLLVSVALVAVALSWFGVKFRRAAIQARIAEALTERGAALFFDCRFDELGNPIEYQLEWRNFLSTLDYVSLGNVIDADLKQLSRIRTLTRLDVARGKIGDVGISRLDGLPKLKFLYLFSTAISDAGLQRLARLSSLEVLLIDSPQIGDGAAEPLSRLRQLRRLYLQGTRISDEGLKKLCALRRLRVIDVRNTCITSRGLEEFRGALPACEILYGDNPAIVPGTQYRDRQTGRQSGLLRIEQCVGLLGYPTVPVSKQNWAMRRTSPIDLHERRRP